MKPLTLSLFAALAVACGGPGNTIPLPITATVSPGASTSLIASARSALAAAGCSATDITWSVQEGAIGGSVTAAGLYTAPACSPSLVLGTYHVIATDAACGKSVSASVAVTDAVASVVIACAIIPPSTTCEPDPANVTVPAGGQIQFFSKVIFTCGEFAYSPPLPNPPPSGVK